MERTRIYTRSQHWLDRLFDRRLTWAVLHVAVWALLLWPFVGPLLAAEFPPMPTVATVAVDTPALDENYKPLEALPKGTEIENLVCLDNVDVCFGNAAGSSISVKGSDLAVVFDGKKLDAHAAKLAFTAALMASAAAPAPPSVSSNLRTEGDSYMDGAYEVALNQLLAKVSGRAVTNTAVGGSEMAGILQRIELPANAGKKPRVTVIWDGSPNGYKDVKSYADQLAQAISALGHDEFVVIPAAIPFGATDAPIEEAIRAEFKRRWPGNFLDWRPVIGNAKGRLDQEMFADPTDPVHLSALAMGTMARAISDFIANKGW